MKRLLLVTYAFPPAPSPGALRPGYLARYLGEFGWEVRVLTHDAGEPAPFAGIAARIGATPHAPLRALLRGIKETLIFPDATAPWIPRALAQARRLSADERFDAVLSTALPSSVHLIGARIAARERLPWIADYRDPWSGNPYMPWGPVKRSLMQAVERRLLQRASAITTITPAIAAILRQVHRGRTIEIVPNAYDPADWSGCAETEPAAFDLTFTGSLYDGKRSPDLLFRAIAALRERGEPAGSEINVHFYGPNGDRIEAAAQRYGIASIVHHHGIVPRSRALRAQRAAAALLILLNADPRTAHETGSKYLEYLGAKRPMLVCGPAGSALGEIVTRARLGWFASDLDDMVDALRDAHRRYRGGEFTIAPDAGGFPCARDLAGRFAHILDRICTADGAIAA